MWLWVQKYFSFSVLIVVVCYRNWQSGKKFQQFHWRNVLFADAFSDGWQQCCPVCNSGPGKWQSKWHYEANSGCGWQEGSKHGEEKGICSNKRFFFSPLLCCFFFLLFFNPFYNFFKNTFSIFCVFFFSTFWQSKLDDYQAKKDKGERLNQDQLVRLNNGSKKWHVWCSVGCAVEMTNKKWYFVKDIVYLYQIIIIIFFLQWTWRKRYRSSKRLSTIWSLLESCRRASCL